MLTQLLGGKQHMSRTAKQFLAQIRSDAQNTITVRLDCAREVFPHPAEVGRMRPLSQPPPLNPSAVVMHAILRLRLPTLHTVVLLYCIIFPCVCVHIERGVNLVFYIDRSVHCVWLFYGVLLLCCSATFFWIARMRLSMEKRTAVRQTNTQAEKG
jgi:hypothetical protein